MRHWDASNATELRVYANFNSFYILLFVNFINNNDFKINIYLSLIRNRFTTQHHNSTFSFYFPIKSN